MVTYREINYGKFGRCLEVSNGTIDFAATLDIGPRIIRFGLMGKENEFYEDIDDNINGLEDAKEFDVFEGDGIWHLYGGHRLWASPEKLPRTYYPDNAPIKYEKIENGVRLIPKKQVWTQLQIGMELSFKDDNTLEVLHKITNKGAWTSEFAPWALSVMAPGGLEVVPQPTVDTVLLPNRKLGLWPYTKMTDSRVYWGDKYITLKQDGGMTGKFKLGIDSEHGWAAYFNHGNLFIKNFDVNREGNYPDGGMSFETFTNRHILEIETLGELKQVLPEECVMHREAWKLYPEVDCPLKSEDSINYESEIEKVLKERI